MKKKDKIKEYNSLKYTIDQLEKFYQLTKEEQLKVIIQLKCELVEYE